MNFRMMLFFYLVVASPYAKAQGSLLVANKNENTVSVFNLSSDKELARIEVGKGPHEIAVSPKGHLAAVANYGDKQTPGSSLSIIDVANKKKINEFSLGDYRRPHGMEFINDEEILVTCETNKALIKVNARSGIVTEIAKTDQLTSHMVAYSSIDKKAYVANITSGSVSVINVVESKLIKNIEVKRGIEGIAVSPDGKEVWVANRDDSTVTAISTSTFEKLATLPAHQVAYRVKFLANGKFVLVSNGISGNLSVYDAKNKKRVKDIDLRDPSIVINEEQSNIPVPVGLTTSTDSKFVFVSLAGYNKVAVIKTSGWKILRMLKTGDGPDGIYYSGITLRP